MATPSRRAGTSSKERALGVGRCETLNDRSEQSSLEWQQQAPEGSGLRNACAGWGREGRGDRRADILSESWAMKGRGGGGSPRGRQDQRHDKL